MKVYIIYIVSIKCDKNIDDVVLGIFASLELAQRNWKSLGSNRFAYDIREEEVIEE